MPDIPHFAEAAKVLRATQRTCPYNNFSNLYVLNGQAPNPRFGGNCLYQAKMFGEQFRAVLDDVPVRLHNETGESAGGHVVPIVGDGDERLACEFVQLASAPIPLAECRGRANERDYAALPLPPAGNRVLRCVWMHRQEQLHMRMSNRDGGGVWYRIATDAPIDIPEARHPINEERAMEPRGKLRLHLLDSDDGKSTVKLDPVDGSMVVQRVGIEARRSGTKAFDSEMARIAGQLGVTTAQLREFFREGCAMERRLVDFG